ncbi:MAG: methionine--tRNA ligase [Patescibacteria group bacterium]
MTKETINYSDFEKLDIRVGRVVDAKSLEWSEKLLEFEVDFGTELGKKTIFSGIKKWYNPEFFKERLYVFIVNLAEKKMGMGVSQGMMLTVDDSAKPFPVEIIDPVVEGSVVR